MSHIPSYTEALDDDDDGAGGEDFAPGYSDSGSESVSVVSGGTTPIKIKLPTNNSTGILSFRARIIHCLTRRVILVLNWILNLV